MSDIQESIPTSDPEAVDRKRFRGRIALMLAIPLLVVSVAVAFYLSGGRFVETDNAYLKANKAPISSEVSGRVQEVLVRDNDSVERGDVLFRIDPAAFETALQRADARLAGVRTELEALQESYRQKQAEIGEADTDLGFWQREAGRQEQLARKGAVSQSQLDESRHNADMARQKKATLELELRRLAAELAGGPGRPLEQHPDYRVASAELEQARLDLARTEVRAPFSGHVSQLPEPGEYITQGKAAAVLIGDDIWVEANFIEADLTHVSEGQPVNIRLDIFPDHHWAGTVESLSPATGAEFAVIPAQNATGNWVKIPQRVTVRIRLDKESAGPQLRAGLSALVEVDTGARCRLPSLCS
ncbi:membrane protein [Marinobacterium nitratireducens]|uniref:Membrane protein n=1 Tax=Marinobacterium nitratireducens TaxID=518897 RepID=A0A917ZEC7_9GAMM|nr:HlyD family secretion protein [Marinobacterium nitratireducens]GGO80359.1 membrane protein [Marinobacterium nitratireducens]